MTLCVTGTCYQNEYATSGPRRADETVIYLEFANTLLAQVSRLELLNLLLQAIECAADVALVVLKCLERKGPDLIRNRTVHSILVLQQQ